MLVQYAAERPVDACWTDGIHDEWMRNLVANTPRLSLDRLQRTRDLMKAAVPTRDIQGYAQHLQGITIPDPDDRHVVAAGITGGVSVIVTWNIRDFPEAELARYGMRRETPDEFLLGLHGAAPSAVLASVANARLNLRVSTSSADDFVATPNGQGLVGFAATLQRHLADL